MSTTSSHAPFASTPTRPRIPALAALAVIRAYRLLVSPWLGQHCRYTPTCSVYTADAIYRYGVLAGTWRGLRRLARCHPWGGDGFDPA